MAEILLSLTIIGVVAAITLPSLTGNINERTWNTQRKALYSRMSQAISLMPAINGYGTLTENASGSITEDNVAETFITAGLSKVLKINNICSNDNLSDCGLPAQITPIYGAKINLPTEVRNLNAGIVDNYCDIVIKSTKAAAFETVNGESILTFYNPNCTPENVAVAGQNSEGYLSGEFVKPHVCVNFIYDLNGNKGPNTVGKDIGTMSVIYSSDSKVVMPMYPRTVAGSFKHNEALKECNKLAESQYRLPNIEELLSLYYNRNVLGQDGFFTDGSVVWSSTVIDSSTAYSIGPTAGIRYKEQKDWTAKIICVQR